MLEGQNTEEGPKIYQDEQNAWACGKLFSDMVKHEGDSPPIYTGKGDEIEDEDFLLMDILGT